MTSCMSDVDMRISRLAILQMILSHLTVLKSAQSEECFCVLLAVFATVPNDLFKASIRLAVCILWFVLCSINFHQRGADVLYYVLDQGFPWLVVAFVCR